MRKALFFVAAAALPLVASLEANASSEGTFEFSASSETSAEETKKKKQKPKSFVRLLLQNVGWQAETDQAYIVTAMAHDANKENESCPEAKDAAAKPEGAEEKDEKDVVGPEPLYFAF